MMTLQLCAKTEQKSVGEDGCGFLTVPNEKQEKGHE